MLDKLHRKNTKNTEDSGTSIGKTDIETATLKRTNITSLREEENVMCNKRSILYKEANTRKKVRFSFSPAQDIDENEGNSCLQTIRASSFSGQHQMSLSRPSSEQV